jgi:hypothetical protein
MERKCQTVADVVAEMNAELNTESPKVGAALSTAREYTPQWLSDAIDFTTRTSINLIEGEEVLSPTCPNHSANSELER